MVNRRLTPCGSEVEVEGGRDVEDGDGVEEKQLQVEHEI